MLPTDAGSARFPRKGRDERDDKAQDRTSVHIHHNSLSRNIPDVSTCEEPFIRPRTGCDSAANPVRRSISDTCKHPKQTAETIENAPLSVQPGHAQPSSRNTNCGWCLYRTLSQQASVVPPSCAVSPQRRYANKPPRASSRH